MLDLDAPIEKEIVVAVGSGEVPPVLDHERFERVGVKVRSFSSGEQLVEAMNSGACSCAVRGTLSAKEVLPYLPPDITRAAVLEVVPGHFSLLLPVGIGEAQTPASKVEAAILATSEARRIGLGHRVAVLAPGRYEDRDRDEATAQGLHDSEAVASRLMTTGIKADLLGIQIEKVTSDHGVVVAPDPVSGNLIFRSLHLVAGKRSLGAVALGIRGIFVDTSRDKSDHTEAVLLAARLSAL